MHIVEKIGGVGLDSPRSKDFVLSAGGQSAGDARGIPSGAAELALRARTVLAPSRIPRTSPATVVAARRPNNHRFSTLCSLLVGGYEQGSTRAQCLAFHRAEPTIPGCVWGVPEGARTVRAKRVPQPRKEHPVRVPGARPARKDGCTPVQNIHQRKPAHRNTFKAKSSLPAAPQRHTPARAPFPRHSR